MLLLKQYSSRKRKSSDGVKVAFSGLPTCVMGGDPPLASYSKGDSNERFEIVKKL